MSVGYSIGKGDIDLALGTIAVDTRNMLSQGQQLVNCLGGLTDAQLANMGYTTTEVTLIRNIQTDINTLLGVFPGTQALPTAHNFLANLSQCYGAR